MKNLFKSILVVAVMLGTYAGYANATLNVKPTINYLEKGDHISVSDSTGEIIYSGKVNYNGNLSNLFNFTKLKNGEYTIEVNKDFIIEVKTISVKNGVVTYLESANEKIFKPVLRIDDSKVLISKLALETSEMEIELYYGEELIHTETVDGEVTLNRVYKLDETLNGDYTAIIKSNDRVFVENFKI